MNTCNECGQGYCESRVRRIFGKLKTGFCSPQCYTKDAVREYDAETAKHDDATLLATKILDALGEENMIGDHIIGDADRFWDALAIVVPLLKSQD